MEPGLKLKAVDVVFSASYVVEVSTAHMSTRDNEILKGHVACTPSEHPQVILEYEHGFLVSSWHDSDYPQEFDALLLKLGHSEAYINLVKLAHKAKAKWLCLDCDAEQYDFLPQFNW